LNAEEKDLETTEANQNRMKAIVALVRITVLTIIALLSFSTVIYGAQNSIFSKETVVSAQTALSGVPERLFNVDLLYAYLQPRVSSAVAVLNFTKISNMTFQSDSGITEVYTVQIFSEGKLVSEDDKMGGIVGGGRIDGHIMLNLGMSGTFTALGNIGRVPLKIHFLSLNPVLKEPISLNLVRYCWITVNGNSTKVDYFKNDIIITVEPSKYQDGFLYNKLLPQEKLSSVDLLNPLKSYSPVSSPTATSEPSSTPTPTVPEFSWLIILPLFASLLFCVVLVRFRNKLNKNTK